MRTVDATFYAQVDPVRSGWQNTETGQKAVVGAAVKRITQARPAKPLPGTVVVELTLRVPVTAFDPLRPRAVVVVPESMVDQDAIQVTVEDAARAVVQEPS